MKSQDTESRRIFFGYHVTDEQIDRLIERIVAEPDMHHFLVLESGDHWVGTLHLANTGNNDIEFGFMIDPAYRGRGLGSRLMDEGILWCRNRGYREIFLHCLTSNKAVQHLCHKHGLATTSLHGESETKVPLDRADLFSFGREVSIRNRQAWRMMLQTAFPILEKLD